MSSPTRPLSRRVALLAVALACLLAAAGFAAGRLRAAPTLQPAVVAQVIEPACPSSVTATSAYGKIADLGTFEVQATDSLVELAYHGRVYAASTDGTGLVYELRVDDAASSAGRIRGVLKSDETGNGVGRSVSMGGFFEGLSAGTHTASLWARVANGTTATTVMYDPGCWSSDHVLVKEYLPFGAIALPAVMNN